MMPRKNAPRAGMLRRPYQDEMLRARTLAVHGWRRVRALLTHSAHSLAARCAPLRRTNVAPRGRPAILIVSHDASRTGAPVLAYNLARRFAERYHVVVLLLGKGSMSEVFRSLAADVILAPHARLIPGVAAAVIAKIGRRFDLEFAIVNSIVSRVVLPSLASLEVPTVTLIHEFAAYVRPSSQVAQVLASPGAVVFSTRLTLEDALSAGPRLRTEGMHMFVQGRCLVPSDGHDAAARACERARLLARMRPEGGHDAAFVVLGATFDMDVYVERLEAIARTLRPARNVDQAPRGTR